MFEKVSAAFLPERYAPSWFPSPFGEMFEKARIALSSSETQRFHPLSGKCLKKHMAQDEIERPLAGFHPLSGKCLKKRRDCRGWPPRNLFPSPFGEMFEKELLKYRSVRECREFPSPFGEMFEKVVALANHVEDTPIKFPSPFGEMFEKVGAQEAPNNEASGFHPLSGKCLKKFSLPVLEERSCPNRAFPSPFGEMFEKAFGNSRGSLVALFSFHPLSGKCLKK